MPEEVTGFLGFGRYHQIEVEDDATLYFKYKDGKNATFITSTGESPGVNRLEVIPTEVFLQSKTESLNGIETRLKRQNLVWNLCRVFLSLTHGK